MKNKFFFGFLVLILGASFFVDVDNKQTENFNYDTNIQDRLDEYDSNSDEEVVGNDPDVVDTDVDEELNNTPTSNNDDDDEVVGNNSIQKVNDSVFVKLSKFGENIVRTIFQTIFEIIFKLLSYLFL